jgi:probable HAF family extracellular repeat protein
MKSRTLTCITSIAFFAALAIPVSLAAQEEQGTQQQKPKHSRYVLVDLGTFGGPNSFYFSSPLVESVNSRGTVVGGADTPFQDPYAPNCDTPDCLIMHPFQWKNGVLTDLGTLPGGSSGTAFWVNDRGLILGGSENGEIDPITGIPENIAVVWRHGEITSLGTLGGSFSFGNAMNSRGQVVGLALNTIPDPFSFVGLGTQTRAFLWDGEEMQDLGTLGGPDGWAASINETGQVAGWAFKSSTPNPTTGIPTQHPFFWEDGTMRDLGTLGGTVALVGSFGGAGSGGALNNRGKVAGTSNLGGDATWHPFLWDRQRGLQDLGTLGGTNGEAYWINDSDEVVGRADIAGSTNHHAFLWKNGVMTDLGFAPAWPCSTALQINAKHQVIIDTGICGVGGGPGSLWEDGTLYDLNTLLVPGTDITVADVNYINDRGEIAARGVLPNGDRHAVLLIPCDGNHADTEGCGDASEGMAVVPQANSALHAPFSHAEPSSRARRGYRAHTPGPGTAPRD